jgi:cell division septal protein FtsQ
MTESSKDKLLSLPQALIWIVSSIFVFTGGGYMAIDQMLTAKHNRLHSPHMQIRRILQTGPDREALPSVYLAELMQLSIDRPTPLSCFDVKLAKHRLLKSPVIEQADVRLIEPDTVYVDYTIRKPVAWLYDFKNVAIDEHGYLFPIAPFFTPKNLPELYLKLAPEELRNPLKGKKIEIGLSLLKLLSSPQFKGRLQIRRLDLSSSLAPSLGKREIVLLEGDTTVRLSAKNTLQDLGNYLVLLDQLTDSPTRPQVVDLRIPKLGFIAQPKKN